MNPPSSPVGNVSLFTATAHEAFDPGRHQAALAPAPRSSGWRPGDAGGPIARTYHSLSPAVSMSAGSRRDEASWRGCGILKRMGSRQRPRSHGLPALPPRPLRFGVQPASPVRGRRRSVAAGGARAEYRNFFGEAPLWSAGNREGSGCLNRSIRESRDESGRRAHPLHRSLDDDPLAVSTNAGATHGGFGVLDSP